jgi:uncharacterized membrane protein SpoIIM required for sporulation
MEKLLAREERKELKERSFKIHRFFVDNREAIKVYAVLFLGIYVTYTLYSFFLPQLGIQVSSVFREQLALESNLRGGAFAGQAFLTIFLNNWWVLLACFLVALIAGDGALFFIAWNASSWGTIFGFRALEAAVNGGAYSAWINLAVILVVTAPHVILEAGAYILAAIAGGVLSDDVTSKREAMSKFIYYFIAGLILFVVLHFLFLVVFAGLPIVAELLDIVAILLILHFLAFVFDDPRHREVFQYNYYLFLLAIALFVAGALVESLVIANVGPLATIYRAAAGF